MSNILTISDGAAHQIQFLLAQREKSALGIRVKVKSGGCSGLSYSIEYAEEALPTDEIVSYKDLKVFVDSKALIFLIGARMDYIEEEFHSGFKFSNPNEKGNCGCGKSFHV